MTATLVLPVVLPPLPPHGQRYIKEMDSSLASVLPLLLPFCSTMELDQLGLVDQESAALCETEWRQRVGARFGSLRFATPYYRKVFKLRSYFKRKVVENVSARVYLMNTRGETTCFPMATGKSMMCSRERAIVYNRCERMFDLSLRINRSIHEISALIGMVSVDEARGLLNEHINLMTSVASLRSSLLFESELFQVFPAPVLLDANTLLRGTFEFPTAAFLDSTTVMMQMWASIDGLIYRPLAPPSIVHAQQEQEQQQEQLHDNVLNRPMDNGGGGGGGLTTPAPRHYRAMKLHELSGMTIHIDDNTLRYRLQQQDMCVNALVSNTYLLYLFNPLQFRPMDWTYEAVLYVGETRCALPVQREGVFLNSNTLAMRVFLSYGKMPEHAAMESDIDDNDDDVGAADRSNSRRGEGSGETGVRGSEHSEPLAIPFDGQAEVFSFLLMATNRITKERKEIANKATCFSLVSVAAEDTTAAPISTTATATAKVAPVEWTAGERQTPTLTAAEDDTQQNEEKETKQVNHRDVSASTHERHVHLPYDAMICYSFSSDYSLQYVEFAIGVEAHLHRLGVSSFLNEPTATTPPPATAKTS